MSPREVIVWAERWWSADSLVKRLCAFCVKFPLEATIALAFYLIGRSLLVAIGSLSLAPEIYIVSPDTTEVIGFGLVLSLVFCNFVRKRATGADDGE